MKRTVIGYSLLLAAALIAATIISVNTPDTPAYAMLAPLLLSVTIVAVGARCEQRFRGTLRLALVLGLALVAACAIMAFKDPTNVATMLPILGAAVLAPIILRLSRDRDDGDTPSRDAGLERTPDP